MQPEPGMRREAVVLHTDAVGSTQRAAENETAAFESLDACRKLIRRLTEQHGGRVVDARADDLLLEFKIPVDAVSCAIEIQRSLAQRNRDVDAQHRLEYRIGIHEGEVLVHGEEISGIAINTAARLERLAQAGGICVSASVYEKIASLVDVEFTDLGRRDLKGAGHMQAFATLVEALDPLARQEDPRESSSGTPAIAVLVFDNMSSVADTLVKGLCEDLIHELASQVVVRVIGHTSSFAYHGRSVSISRAGQEMGARYVVEGSLQQRGDGMRVTMQLVDSLSGHHKLSRRYDLGPGEPVPSDELTQHMASELLRAVLRAEEERIALRRQPPSDAWEAAQKGWWYLNQRSPEANRQAKVYFEEALGRLATSAWARYGLLVTCFYDIFYRWVEGPDLFAAIESVRRLGEEAGRLDPDRSDPHARLARGIAHIYSGEIKAALAEATTAVELSPSFGLAHFARAIGLQAERRLDEALDAAQRAVGLSPHDRMLFAYHNTVATTHFMAKRYEQAREGFLETLRHRHGWSIAEAMLAACHAQLGDLDRARQYARSLETADPPFSLPNFKLAMALIPQDYWAPLEEGLARAGIGENG